MNELESLKKEIQALKFENEILKNKIGNSKRGMKKKAKEGKIMSRAPFGYKIIKNNLIPQENAKIVEDLFLEFRDKEISLNKLAKKYGFSVNGLKKILTNFTYIGKIKFDGESHPGNHKPIISMILFNQVQDKLERLQIKIKL